MSSEHLYRHALKGKLPANHDNANPLIRSTSAKKPDARHKNEGAAVENSTAAPYSSRPETGGKGSERAAHGGDAHAAATLPSGADEGIRAAQSMAFRKAAKKTGKTVFAATKSMNRETVNAIKTIDGATSADHGGQGGRNEHLAPERMVELVMKDKANAIKKSVGGKISKAAGNLAKKAIKGAGKLIADLARAIINLIGASSSSVLLIVAAVAVIGLVVGSAFGILIDDNNPNTPPVDELVADNEAFLQDTINDIYFSISPEPDIVLMDFYSLSENGLVQLSERLNNWPDIMAIWSVRTTMLDNLDVVEIDMRKQLLFQRVFQDMVEVEYEVKKDHRKEIIPNAETGEETIVYITITTLHYTITSKSYPVMYREYMMSSSMKSMTEELKASEEFELLALSAARAFNPRPYPLTGGSVGGQIVDFNVFSLPPSALASSVVNAASRYLGTPYDTIDCSLLTQTVYGSLGVSLPRTAAEQARYIISNDRAIDKSDLQPGDLIFYALKGDNGRYMHVSHVAIYAGDGMIIDASSINGYTIYREMDTFSDGSTVLYGRP